jgi:RNA polymerase sigma-70 factor (ECF subfamily)
MRAWLRPASLQTADIDNLTQGVLQVVIRKLPQFKHSGKPGAFRAWLREITLNLLREFWRRQKPGDRAPATATILDELEDPASGISRWREQEHNRHVVDGLLRLVEGDFNSKTWQSFRRQVIDEIPADQVAAELQMTINAVLIAKSRVLSRLRLEARGLID